MTKAASYNAKLADLLAPVLAKWHLVEPPQLYLAKLKDDFGYAHTSFLLAGTINNKLIDQEQSLLAGKTIYKGQVFNDTASNFAHVAKSLGISIYQSSDFYFPRDHFLHLPNGQVALPHASCHLSEAIARARSRALYFQKSAACYTNNQLFNVWNGYTSSHQPNAADVAYVGASQHFAYTYVEGGNVFLLTNAKGQPQVFIGEDHFFHTLLHLELGHRDWDLLANVALPATQNSSGYFADLCQKAYSNLVDLKEPLEEMFALGLWPEATKSGLVAFQDQLNMLLLRFFLEGKNHSTTTFRSMAIAAGLIPPFETVLLKQDLAAAKRAAASYLVKKHIVRHLIALDFQLPVDEVYFVPQVSYHLDCYLTPGPGNTFFITSFAFLKELLDCLLQQQSILELTPADAELLAVYRDTAGKMHRELGPLLGQVQKSLELSGKQVLPLPAHVLFEPPTLYQEFPIPTLEKNAYFGNAITGYAKNKKTYYYITHGFHAGLQCGSLICQMFHLALAAYVPNIELYFLGHKPHDPADFSEALDAWSRLETQYGLHCTTFPVHQA